MMLLEEFASKNTLFNKEEGGECNIYYDCGKVDTLIPVSFSLWRMTRHLLFLSYATLGSCVNLTNGVQRKVFLFFFSLSPSPSTIEKNIDIYARSFKHLLVCRRKWYIEEYGKDNRDNVPPLFIIASLNNTNIYNNDKAECNKDTRDRIKEMLFVPFHVEE